MTTFTRLLLVAAVASLLATPMVLAQAPDEKQRAELAAALTTAKLSLDRGFAVSRTRGKPVSGKYEVEEGRLRLSVYVATGDQSSEVIVDHATGKVTKVERIHEGADLTAAKSQQEAMSKAKKSLQAATAKAVKANKDYRAVSVVPEMMNGHPCAEVTMVKGSDWMTISERLD